MDCILQCNHYSPAEVRRLNYCHQFIGAVTVSDITLPCGAHLDVHKTHGHPSTSSSRNTHLQVHQGNPSQAEWRLLRRACLLWSDINGKLRQPLGKWLVPLAQQRHQHFAHVLGDYLWLLTNTLQQYKVYRRYEVDEGGYHALQHNIHISTIPDHAIPTTVEKPSAACPTREVTLCFIFYFYKIWR